MTFEIERLRADNAALSKAVVDIQEERDLAQAEFRTYHKAWEEQAARTKELEDALVEAKAAIKFCLDEGDEDENYGPVHDLPEWRELPEKDKNTFRDWCRKQLQADGKIGPDAETGNRDHVVGPDQMIPNGKCWQITEERKAAIWHAVAVLKENDPDDEHLWDEEIAVLRAMLREAE